MQSTAVSEPAIAEADVTRGYALRMLALIFLLSCVARGLLLRYIEAPFIQTDEALYLNLARSMATGNGALWNGNLTFFPSWLYPWLMSLVIDHGAWPLVYGGMRLINVGLMSLIPLGVFALTREVASRRAALQAAGLSALLPGLCYSTAIMTENAYYPACVLAFWLIFRAINQPGLLRCVLAGLACGLAFHAKPNGIVLAPIAGLTAMIYEAVQLVPRGQTAWSRLLADYLRRLLRYAPMAIVWLLVMSLRALELHQIEHQPVSLQSMFSFYMFMAHGRFTVRLIDQWQSFGAYLVGWIALAGFVLPFALAGSLGGASRSRLGLLRLFAGVVCLTMLVMAARHPLLNDGDWRFYERYLSPSLPVLIALFCAANLPVRLGVPARVLRGVWIVVIGAGAFYIAQRTMWTTNNDSPTMTFFALFHKPDEFPPGIFVLVALLLLTAAWLLTAGRRPAQRALGVAAWFLCANVMWYASEKCFYEDFYNVPNQITRRIARITQPADRVHVMLDGLENRVIWGVDSCFNGLSVFRDPAFGQWNAAPWVEFPARLGSMPGRLPEGVDYILAAPGALPELESVRRMEGGELYRLAPPIGP